MARIYMLVCLLFYVINAKAEESRQSYNKTEFKLPSHVVRSLKDLYIDNQKMSSNVAIKNLACLRDQLTPHEAFQRNMWVKKCLRAYGERWIGVNVDSLDVNMNFDLKTSSNYFSFGNMLGDSVITMPVEETDGCSEIPARSYPIFVCSSERTTFFLSDAKVTASYSYLDQDKNTEIVKSNEDVHISELFNVNFNDIQNVQSFAPPKIGGSIYPIVDSTKLTKLNKRQTSEISKSEVPIFAEYMDEGLIWIETFSADTLISLSSGANTTIEVSPAQKFLLENGRLISAAEIYAIRSFDKLVSNYKATFSDSREESIRRGLIQLEKAIKKFMRENLSEANNFGLDGESLLNSKQLRQIRIPLIFKGKGIQTVNVNYDVQLIHFDRLVEMRNAHRDEDEAKFDSNLYSLRPEISYYAIENDDKCFEFDENNNEINCQYQYVDVTSQLFVVNGYVVASDLLSNSQFDYTNKSLNIYRNDHASDVKMDGLK